MKTISYEKKKQIIAYLFLLPWLLGVVFFFIIPFIQSFIYSFSSVKINPGSLDIQFVGLDNYKKAFLEDPYVKPAIIASVTSVLYQVPLILIFSIFVATLLNQKFKGRLLARAIFFLPVIISGSVVISILRGDALSNAILSGAKSGTMFEVNSLEMMMTQWGIGDKIILFITNMISNIFNLSWRSGVQILLFLAALQNIPGSYYEVASIDGANKWVLFWKVTFPMISPMLMTGVVYSIIDGFLDSMNPLVNLIYDASTKLDIPYAAALSWTNMVITLVIIGISYVIIDKRITYFVE